VLVFLPGINEISVLHDSLSKDPSLHLVVLHSTISKEDQEYAVTPCPEGKKKVVLATNIAESSLTIPDVTTVIDTGICNF
jgi:HrpA-like RNA helicase